MNFANSISLSRVASEQDLRRRLRRFWSDNGRRKVEVRRLLQRIEAVGNVAVFGGMIRDFAITGALGFRSDIDLVVSLDDPQRLKWLLREFDSKSNRFGGYRVRLNHWVVDIWPVILTWAFTQNHVTGDSFQDLTRTTFFNWDAAVFEVSEGRLYLKEGYLEAISQGLLDINLAANPNPAGMVFRTWRMMKRYDASITPRLAEYVASTVEQQRKEILDRYSQSAGYSLLDEKSLMTFYDHVRAHIDDLPLLPVRLPVGQKSLHNMF